ncbi:MAG: hypothetical protein WC588_02060 [Candidatus Micrarchaeia archaeon]
MNGKMHGQAAIESFCGTIARPLRGQAAMEYLMTYGWALLVIVAVIAVLLIINPFAAPAGCRFDQVGFQCANPLINTNGTIYMQITNSNNNLIVLHSVMCTTDKSTSVPSVPDTVLMGNLARQATLTVNMSCYKPGTTTPIVLSTGNDFTGKVWLFYNNEEDDVTTYPKRVVSATVTTKVSQ